MGNKKQDKRGAEGPGVGPDAGEKMSGKQYEEELYRLHVELVKLQDWVKASGAKVCILFEGRDGAGKGGVIKAMTERVSPRVFRVVALPAPPSARKARCTYSAIFPTCPPRERS